MFQFGPSVWLPMVRVWSLETTRWLLTVLSGVMLSFLFQGKCYVWKINEEKSDLPRYQAVTKFSAHKKYITRVLLSPDVKCGAFAMVAEFDMFISPI